MRRIVALTALAVLVAALGAAVLAAGHDHGHAGLYDPECPLVALVAQERHDGNLPPPVWRAVTTATALPAAVRWHSHGPSPAADARLRAPPAR